MGSLLVLEQSTALRGREDQSEPPLRLVTVKSHRPDGVCSPHCLYSSVIAYDSCVLLDASSCRRGARLTYGAG